MNKTKFVVQSLYWHYCARYLPFHEVRRCLFPVYKLKLIIETNLNKSLNPKILKIKKKTFLTSDLIMKFGSDNGLGFDLPAYGVFWRFLILELDSVVLLSVCVVSYCDPLSVLVCEAKSIPQAQLF